MKNDIFSIIFLLSLALSPLSRADLLSDNEASEGPSYHEQLVALYKRGTPTTREDLRSITQQAGWQLEGRSFWAKHPNQENITAFFCFDPGGGWLYKCGVFSLRNIRWHRVKKAKRARRIREGAQRAATTVLTEPGKTFYLDGKYVASYRKATFFTTVEVDGRKYIVHVSTPAPQTNHGPLFGNQWESEGEEETDGPTPFVPSDIVYAGYFWWN